MSAQPHPQGEPGAEARAAAHKLFMLELGHAEGRLLFQCRCCSDYSREEEQNHTRTCTFYKVAAALEAKEREIERLKPDKEHEEWMASQLCAIEDALGCRNDYDPKTGLIDTHSKCLERIRDLIAAEGERGDLKQERDNLAQQLAEANEENRLLKLAGAITDCLNGSKRTKSPYHRANANTESLEMDNDFPDDELPNK